MRLDARFWDKVDTTGDCWVWTAGIAGGGYGYFWHEGRMQRAHRLLFKNVVGEVPSGIDLDHLCRNRRCVRPDHLERVTRSENLRRGAAARKAEA